MRNLSEPTFKHWLNVKDVLFCDFRYKKYPNARAMGFPFDRLDSENLIELDDFIKNRANMITTNITIWHIHQIVKHNSVNNLNVVKTASTHAKSQPNQ